MLYLSSFKWTLRSSVVFNNFLLIATDRSKISSDQNRLFFAVSHYRTFHFSRTLHLSLSLKNLMRQISNIYLLIDLRIIFIIKLYCRYVVVVVVLLGLYTTGTWPTAAYVHTCQRVHQTFIGGMYFIIMKYRTNHETSILQYRTYSEFLVPVTLTAVHRIYSEFLVPVPLTAVKNLLRILGSGSLNCRTEFTLNSWFRFPNLQYRIYSEFLVSVP